MIFDGPLLAAGDDDDLVDSSRHRLFHGVLDYGLINEGEHLLGLGFGGGKEAGAPTRCRKDCLAYSHLPSASISRKRGRVDEFMVVSMNAVAQPKPARLRWQPYRPHDLADLRSAAVKHPAAGHPGQDVARIAMELERTGGETRRFGPGDRRLWGHDIEKADPPGPALNNVSAARAASGYVVRDDRGDPDAIQFHRCRIVAGRKEEGVARRPMDRDDGEIPPAEAARDRRRDRDVDAPARAGMRTGLAKQFKQVLDSQRKRAQEDEKPGPEDAPNPRRGDTPSPSPRRKP